MIPKILHQCKASPLNEFTWEEQRLAKRARKLMPEWAYYAWTDENSLELIDKLCPQYLDDYARLPTGGSRTDVARYLWMYQCGGIYFDTDFRFFQAIGENLLSHECILGVEEEDAPELGGGPKLGNAFIGSQQGLALWMELVDSIFRRFRKGERLEDTIFLTGPYALNTFLRNHNHYEEMVTILPRHVLYPVRTKFYLTAVRNPDTIGVHLMWGSWRYMSRPHKLKNWIRRVLSAAL